MVTDITIFKVGIIAQLWFLFYLKGSIINYTDLAQGPGSCLGLVDSGEPAH